MQLEARPTRQARSNPRMLVPGVVIADQLYLEVGRYVGLDPLAQDAQEREHRPVGDIERGEQCVLPVGLRASAVLISRRCAPRSDLEAAPGAWSSLSGESAHNRPSASRRTVWRRIPGTASRNTGATLLLRFTECG